MYEEFIGAAEVFGDFEADSHQVPDLYFFVRGAASEDAAFVRNDVTVQRRPLNGCDVSLVALELV